MHMPSQVREVAAVLVLYGLCSKPGDTVMSRIKAGLIHVEADVRARLLFKSGILILCVSTLKPGLCADGIS